MRIHQAAAEAPTPSPLNHNPKLEKAIIKSVKIDALIMLVEKAGLSFPLIVGISAKAKTKLPIENTKSCHCIFRFYISFAILKKLVKI